MPTDYLKNLVRKYAEGECSEEEISLVLDYLATPEGQAYLSALIDQDIAGIDDLLAVGTSTPHRNIWHRMRPPMATAPKTKKLPRKYWMAASVTGLLMIWATYLLLFTNPEPVIYRTAYGETKSILLSDSTTVTLNANSVLTLTDNFVQQREVWIQGEAFFEVAEEPQKPTGNATPSLTKFIVNTDRLRIEVTGTSFNVRDREDKTQVVLNTGQVRLRPQNNLRSKELLMQPGEMVAVSARDGVLTKSTVQPDIYSSWRDHKLVCDDTPLREIAQVVYHEHGKTMIFREDRLAERVISGTLPTHDLDLLLEVLAVSLKLTIDSQADTLYIAKE